MAGPFIRPFTGEAPRTGVGLPRGRSAQSVSAARQALDESKGWPRLSGDERRRIGALVLGQHNGLSRRARLALGRRLEATVAGHSPWGALEASHQAEALRGLLTDAKVIPRAIRDLLPPAQGRRVSFTIAPPKPGELQFSNGHGAARLFDVRYPDKTVRILQPVDLTGAQANHSVQDVAAAIAELPPENRALLDNVVLEPREYGCNGSAASRLGQPSFKAYMEAIPPGGLRIYPRGKLPLKDQLYKTLLHETGHLCGPKWAGGLERWSRAMKSDGVAVSRYGNSQLGEDIAEAFSLFCATRGSPQHAEYRALFPGRFAALDELFRSSVG